MKAHFSNNTKYYHQLYALNNLSIKDNSMIWFFIIFAEHLVLLLNVSIRKRPVNGSAKPLPVFYFNNNKNILLKHIAII